MNNVLLSPAASAIPASATFATTSGATASSTATRPLWAAVAVLGVCVVAMGATLVKINHGTEPLAQASLPMSSAKAATGNGWNLASNKSSDTPMITETADGKEILPQGKPVPNTAKQASSAGVRTSTASNMPSAKSPANASASVPAVAQARAPAVCLSCGTVEAVTPFKREGQGSGVGVITGGVLGGVVGNQVGKGNGRTVATVLGAVGGGWAGNKIEKNMKATTAYNVRVRMQDGSSRTIEQSSAPMVGSKVTVDGNVIRPA